MTLIEDVLDLETPSWIQISPNSQQVVWSTSLSSGHKKGDHAVSTIWLGETGKAGSARQLTPGLSRDESPIWAPDGKSIALISDRTKAGESSAIYVLSLAGGEAYPVTPADAQRPIAKFEFSPDGKFIAFLQADEKTKEQKQRDEENGDVQVYGEDWAFNRLKLVHVATKKVTTLVSRERHCADFCWSPDGRKIAWTEAASPEIQDTWGPTDIYAAEIAQLSAASNNGSDEPVCRHPGSAANIIWVGDNIYFCGLAEKELIITSKIVYSIKLGKNSDGAPSSVKHEACGDTDCAESIQRTGDDITLKVLYGQEDQIRMLGGRTLYASKKQVLAWHASFTSNSDELVLAIAQSSTNSPSEVFTTTSSGGALVQLSSHGQTLTSTHPPFGSCTHFTNQSSDGEVSLDSMYFAPTASESPSGEPTKPLPTVVCIHGGPYYRKNEHFDGAFFAWQPLLLAAGYGMLMPMYRGSSGRGEKFAAYSRGGMGKYDYADVITCTQAAVEKGFADKERLIVAGWSQGGFLSYLAAVRNGLHGLGWKFRAAIPGAGVTDWDGMMLTSDVSLVQAQMAGGLPWKLEKDDTRTRQGSALWEFGDAVKKGGVIPPMLMLHGEKDVRVPISQAWGFRIALRQARLPFEFVTYPREGHVIVERKHLVDMLERVRRFCDVHLA